MPNIYAHNGDANIYKLDGTWSTARDSNTGTALFTTQGYTTDAVICTFAKSSYTCTRAFFYFDTSAITQVAPSAASLKIRGYSNSSARLYVVKGTHGSSLSTANFDSIEGWAAATDNTSNVTKYVDSEVTSWSVIGYNVMILNAQARQDMLDNDGLAVVLIQSTHDLANSAPTDATQKNGLHWSDTLSLSNRPNIDYTAGVASTQGYEDNRITTITTSNLTLAGGNVTIK